MSDEDRKAKKKEYYRLYQRKWREANRERYREYQTAYYAANRERLNEYQRRYYQANRERKLKQFHDYYNNVIKPRKLAERAERDAILSGTEI